MLFGCGFLYCSRQSQCGIVLAKENSKHGIQKEKPVDSVCNAANRIFLSKSLRTAAF
jgi:hypothetical protein